MLQNLQKQNMDAELKILRGLLLDMLVRGLSASSQANWFRRIPTILTSCSSSMDVTQAASNTQELMSVFEVPTISHPDAQESSLVQPQVNTACSFLVSPNCTHTKGFANLSGSRRYCEPLFLSLCCDYRARGNGL